MSDDLASVFSADRIEAEVRDQYSRINDEKSGDRSRRFDGDQESAENERHVLGEWKSNRSENEEKKKTYIGRLF